MGRRVPVRKSKKKRKLGCRFGWPFWPGYQGRFGVGTVWQGGLRLGLRVGVGHESYSRTPLGMQLSGERWRIVQNIYTLPTDFCWITRCARNTDTYPSQPSRPYQTYREGVWRRCGGGAFASAGRYRASGVVRTRSAFRSSS